MRPVAPDLGEYELVTAPPIPPGRAWDIAHALRDSDAVVEAEPLFRYAGLEPDPERLDTFLAPHERPRRAKRASSGDGGHKDCARTDPLWSLKDIKAVDAWALLPNPPAKGIVVGHPDTGYTRHPEIWGGPAGPVLATQGRDYVDEDADPEDRLNAGQRGHGTATASVVMSPTATAVAPGVSGVAPGASLVPVRVSTSVVHFSFSNLTRALYHLVDQVGVHLISMSLGGPFPSRALERALDYGIERGVIPLAAAGNVWPFVVYPARYEQVIAVAASNCRRGEWIDSAGGGAIDVSAPGESVWRASANLASGNPVFGVGMSSGTSYAVATVAGACALWLARHGRAALIQRYGAPALASVFRRVLLQAGFTTPTGWDTDRMGVGIVDARKLLEAPLPATGTGVRSSAPRGPLESALEFFPDDEPDRVMDALARRIPSPGPSRAARVRNAFQQLGDELLFHLGTNPDLRARIHAEASTRGRRAAPRGIQLHASRRFRGAFRF